MSDGAAMRWAARRALAEGEPATLPRLAAAFGVAADRLERRARRQGWRLSGPALGLTRAQRIARVHDRLLGRIERAQAQAEAADDEPGRTAIADISAAARLLAKVSETIRDEGAAKEEQMERDADIADILDRLDARIVALARHFAEGLVGGRVLPRATGEGEP